MISIRNEKIVRSAWSNLSNSCKRNKKRTVLILGAFALLVTLVVGGRSIARHHNPLQQNAEVSGQKAAQAAPDTKASPTEQPIAAYQIQDGDTLWWISARACNDPLRFSEIVFADGSKITDPRKIHSPERVLLPADCPIGADFTPHRITWASAAANTYDSQSSTTPDSGGADTTQPAILPEPQNPQPGVVAPTVTEPATGDITNPNALATAPPSPQAPTAQPSPQAPTTTSQPTAEDQPQTVASNSKLQAIEVGAYPAVFLNPTTRKWTDTKVLISSNGDGSIDVATKIPSERLPGETLAFIAGARIQLNTERLDTGKPIGRSTVKKFNLTEGQGFAANKKALHEIVGIRDRNKAVRILIPTTTFVAQLTIGFCYGGPVGAGIVGGANGASFFGHWLLNRTPSQWYVIHIPTE
jgi:hypothetical protein